MIQYTQGNLLEAKVEALVNTVNEVGVMGKGIALMFREAFPENTEAYEAACRASEVRVGRMLVTRNYTLNGPRWIINFPTKRHWRHPSKLEWVQAGLEDLVQVIQENSIRSIALPPLGCGQGGLDWNDVRPEIEKALAELPEVDVLVFEPTAKYQNKPKATGVQELTPARALVAELVRRYSILGMDCTNIEIQKLAWFLNRTVKYCGLKDPLRLNFQPNRYGPYADNLRHLLDSLDGSFLHGEKRLADAGPMDMIWFEDARRGEVEAFLQSPKAAEYAPALKATAELIEGFESPLGMELLATVDWLLYHGGCEPTVPSLRAGLATWPGGEGAGARKQRLFDDRLLKIALEHLTRSALGQSYIA